MFNGISNSPQKSGEYSIRIPEIPILLWSRDAGVGTTSLTTKLVRFGTTTLDDITTPSPAGENNLYYINPSYKWSSLTTVSIEATGQTDAAGYPMYYCLVDNDTHTVLNLGSIYLNTNMQTTRSNTKISINDIIGKHLGVGFSNDGTHVSYLQQARLIIFPYG